jgi:iron complex outermembrane receptor protein
MINSKRVNFLLVCCAGMTSTAGNGAFAQSAAPTADSSNGALEEIVVTAEKRQQRLSDVGMSITAISGDALKELGVASINDFAKVDPSFNYSQSESGTPTYSIRGVGYNNFALASPPAVSAYVDEVPFSYSSLTKGADMDLERVEVLKGPQGTLFGQNSTAGAINFIAAKPTSSFESAIEATSARFDALNVNGYISGPVSDTLRLRFAYDADSGGAWQRSYTRDDSLGDRRFERARFLADWTPSNDLSVHVSLNGWRDNSDTQAGQYVGIPTDYATLNGNPPIKAFLENYPLAPANPQAADWQPGNDLKVDENFYQASVRVDYDFSPAVRLTSLSAYSHFQGGTGFGFDGVNPTNFGVVTDGHVHSFSQELRLSGSLPQVPLHWLIGGDYISDKVLDIQYLDFSHDAIDNAFVGFGGPLVSGVTNITHNDVRTEAAFFNVNYDIVQSLVFSLGARYTDSRTGFSGCTYDPGDGTWAAGINALQAFFKGLQGPAAAPFVRVPPGGCSTLDATVTPGLVRNVLDQNNTSWRTGLDWKITGDALLYVNVSKGFKAGGFPTATNLKSTAFSPAVQESVLATEAGFKTAWLHHTVNLSGAYFHYDYDNKQVQGQIPDPLFGAAPAIVNVPHSKIDGAELSFDWRPADGLTLSASGVYLDSKVTTDFFNIDRSSDVINYKGLAFPLTPRWAFISGATYEWNVPGGLKALAGVNYTYQGSTYQGFGNLPYEYITSYGLLDARVGLKSATDTWHAELFGTNITNRYYWNTAGQDGDTFFRLAGKPAIFGVRVGYHFR